MDIAAAVLGLILMLVIVIAMKPAEFAIERSARIAAPASKIFEQLNDFHHWENWSPWAKLDPTMKEGYDGPTSGVGASHWWSGNQKVGEGRSTITESRPVEYVGLRLEFIRPFKAVNDCEFRLRPDGTATEVAWRMTGRNNFMGKAFGLLMNMDKMIGNDFEKGLEGLRRITE